MATDTETGRTENDVMLASEEENETDLTKERGRAFWQVLVTLVVSLGCFVHGTSVVFPALYLPSILDDRSVSHMENANIGTVVSVAAVGMLTSSLMAGPVANLLGRKFSSVFGTGLVFFLSFLLVSTIDLIIDSDPVNYAALLLGRFLMGVGLGFSTNLSTLIIMETAEPGRRASLAVVPALTGSLGVLFCQISGAVLNWRQLSLTLAALALIVTFLLLLMPETPVHLIRRRPQQAQDVLRLLRGPHFPLEAELEQLKKAASSTDNNKDFKWMELAKKEHVKPLAICLALMFFFQLSGISVVMQFTVSIFQRAAPTLDAFTSTILVGLALFASNVATLFVAQKLPRRLMLLVSSASIALCLLGLGLHFRLNKEDDEEDMAAWRAWVPVLLLMAYMPTFTLGYGSMIWITVTELLPLRIRPAANGLCVAFTCLVSFVVTQSFPSMQRQMGSDNVFFVYAFFSALGFVFVLTAVPETKGFNEEQITKRYRD